MHFFNMARPVRGFGVRPDGKAWHAKKQAEALGRVNAEYIISPCLERLEMPGVLAFGRQVAL
jgi:streptogramin lyase